MLAGKVDVYCANPGTSEMQFVAALDKVHGMRAQVLMVNIVGEHRQSHKATDSALVGDS